MLASISPLGERARRQRWWLTVTAYTVASTAAGAAVGAMLGAFGAVALSWESSTAPLWAFAAFGGLGLLVDATGRRVPGPRRQVNEDWLTTYRGWVYGAGFGAQLGAGVLTIVPSTATWLALLAALLVGFPAGGALVGAVYGLARSLPVLAAARVEDGTELRALVRRVHAARSATLRLVLGVQAGVVLLALGLAIL